MSQDQNQETAPKRSTPKVDFAVLEKKKKQADADWTGRDVVDIINPWRSAWRRFREDGMAVSGLIGIIFLLLFAVFAPLLANGRPLLLVKKGGELASPAWRYIFAPDSTEVMVEMVFNYFLLLLPVALLLLLFRKIIPAKIRWSLLVVYGLLLLLPFFMIKPRLDKTDWRQVARDKEQTEFALFAPIPYGPFENVAKPFDGMSFTHLFGTDQIGRDVFSRMVYGARVSLAVGILATGIVLSIGISAGMFFGYYGGKIDMVGMRIVEVIICFPRFLLLLILMAIMMDYKFDQSILLVIAVLGLTGWTGLSRIVRGEVLRQRSLPYIRSCEALAIPVWRIMFFHLLPNILGPIFVYFTFGVAGAILAESSLSFLGFGVQAPTASWGELLRQAFGNPFAYWHLTLWPGLAIFTAVISFNFAGEGLRRTFDPRSK